ncbi:hypothetical protein Hanom_Chr17g01527461 [Helianthus anomalus]
MEVPTSIVEIWFIRSSRGAARARSTSKGVPRPPKISLQAAGSLEISSPCNTVQGGRW